MFRVWLNNFGYFAEGEYKTFEEAVDRAIEVGFESTIQEYTLGTWFHRANWTPLGGLRRR